MVIVSNFLCEMLFLNSVSQLQLKNMHKTATDESFIVQADENSIFELQKNSRIIQQLFIVKVFYINKYLHESILLTLSLI